MATHLRCTPKVAGLVECQASQGIAAIGVLSSEPVDHFLRERPIRQFCQLKDRSAAVVAESVVQAASARNGRAKEITRFVENDKPARITSILVAAELMQDRLLPSPTFSGREFINDAASTNLAIRRG